MFAISLARSRVAVPSAVRTTRSIRSLSTTTVKRNLSALLSPEHEDDSDEYSPEVLPTEGEWAGCSQRFMAPIKISVRGGGTLVSMLCVLENKLSCTYSPSILLH